MRIRRGRYVLSFASSLLCEFGDLFKVSEPLSLHLINNNSGL